YATRPTGRRTRRRARPMPPRRTAITGSADPAGRPARVRRPRRAPAGTAGSTGVDGDRGDRNDALLQLDLEDAGDGRRDVELDLPARLDVHADVIAVEVDLVGDVGLDDEPDVVTLGEGEILNAADRLT